MTLVSFLHIDAVSPCADRASSNWKLRQAMLQSYKASEKHLRATRYCVGQPFGIPSILELTATIMLPNEYSWLGKAFFQSRVSQQEAMRSLAEVYAGTKGPFPFSTPTSCPGEGDVA
jgi:hypothetical protein